MDEEKLIILVQGHECLHNLQHKDYDNYVVKDNCWKEKAGKLHAQDKELPRTQHCRRMAGSWQGRGRRTAGERHGMCESALRFSAGVSRR
jgi:5-methylcytosine-specific restriction endonuclease McrA